MMMTYLLWMGFLFYQWYQRTAERTKKIMLTAKGTMLKKKTISLHSMRVSFKPTLVNLKEKHVPTDLIGKAYLLMVQIITLTFIWI